MTKEILMFGVIENGKRSFHRYKSPIFFRRFRY